MRVRTCWEASNACPISSRMSIVWRPHGKKTRSRSVRNSRTLTPDATWKKYAVYHRVTPPTGGKVSRTTDSSTNTPDVNSRARPGREVPERAVLVHDRRQVCGEPVPVAPDEEVVDAPQRVVERSVSVDALDPRGHAARARDPVPAAEELVLREVLLQRPPESRDLPVRGRVRDHVVPAALLRDEPIDARALHRLDHRDERDHEQDEGEHRDGHRGPEALLHRVREGHLQDGAAGAHGRPAQQAAQRLAHVEHGDEDRRGPEDAARDAEREGRGVLRLIQELEGCEDPGER